MADGIPGSHDRDESLIDVLRGCRREPRRLAVEAECDAADVQQQASMYDSAAHQLKERAMKEEAAAGRSESAGDPEEAQRHRDRSRNLAHLTQSDFRKRGEKLRLAASNYEEATHQRNLADDLENVSSGATEV